MTDLCCSDVGKVPRDVSKVLFVDVYHLCDDVRVLVEVDPADEVAQFCLLLSKDKDVITYSDDGDADVDVIF